METLDEGLSAIERLGKINREANKAIVDGHLEASAMVVAQLGALVAQGLVKRPDFIGTEPE